MDPLLIYAGLIALGLVVVTVAVLMSPAPRRPCPGCDRPIATSARLCRRCGYAFT